MGKERKDLNGYPIRKGDVINLHQTVNGQNLFIVLSIEPLDVRYAHDLLRNYEYDKEDLFVPDKFTGETETEVVANIYDNYLNHLIES